MPLFSLRSLYVHLKHIIFPQLMVSIVVIVHLALEICSVALRQGEGLKETYHKYLKYDQVMTMLPNYPEIDLLDQWITGNDPEMNLLDKMLNKTDPVLVLISRICTNLLLTSVILFPTLFVSNKRLFWSVTVFAPLVYHLLSFSADSAYDSFATEIQAWYNINRRSHVMFHIGLTLGYMIPYWQHLSIKHILIGMFLGRFFWK